MDLSPKSASVEREGTVQRIPVEELEKGDIVIIKAGESIPCDGVVVFGSASVDQSAITGESIPVEKSTGDKVISATINKSGFVKIKATRVGERDHPFGNNPAGGGGFLIKGAYCKACG